MTGRRGEAPPPAPAPLSDRTDVGRFAAVVADIARTLESPQDAGPRIEHVLGLVSGLVPCDRCAFYTRAGGREPALTVVPAAGPDERARLAQFLDEMMRFMDGDVNRRRTFDSRIHLALPVIGLDEILGVLLVDRAGGEEYEPHHLQLLSAIGSQLGSYLTMVRLHHETVEQTTLLVDREQQLRGAARFREEFIGVVGHDLRNPLSAIRTGAQLLRKRASLDDRDVAVVDRIAASADRMSRMIDELLDFARGRLGGGIPLRRAFVDLHALCREVAAEAHAAHGRPVRLHVTGNPGGHWDGDRLAQMLSNLAGNAMQHSPPSADVTITVRDDGEYAAVDINNAGPPIPAAQLAHIFQPFRRGDRASSPGLGLGLYIVERIVHAHGGSIAVQSSTDEGTTFTVRLPRRRGSDRDAQDVIDRVERPSPN
jgi:signal transduction histidine kinase